ncbi:MAG: sodium:calcium antiporter [Caldimicrobium sp.]
MIEILYWFAFFLCTGIITFCGSRLSKYGDIIAEKTGLSATWIGIILMATVTSLPELITGISSVTYAEAPDIAVGDILGSCIFNMLILSLIDIQYRPAPITSMAHHGHILSAGLCLLLLTVVSLGLFLGERIYPFGWIGPYTLIFIFLYLVGMKLIYVYEKKRLSKYIKERAIKYEDIYTKKAVFKYVLNATFVIVAAILLPEIGKGIAEITGLGQTFVGNILIAFTTSLPEVVVTFSAVKIGAIELAIGNLFGSNLFNIFVLGIDDIFYFKGPLLSYVNKSHIVSALSAMAMISIAIIGITYRAERKKLFLAWDSLGLILVYLINVMLLYSLY